MTIKIKRNVKSTYAGRSAKVTDVYTRNGQAIGYGTTVNGLAMYFQAREVTVTHISQNIRNARDYTIHAR